MAAVLRAVHLDREIIVMAHRASEDRKQQDKQKLNIKCSLEILT